MSLTLLENRSTSNNSGSKKRVRFSDPPLPPNKEISNRSFSPLISNRSFSPPISKVPEIQTNVDQKIDEDSEEVPTPSIFYDSYKFIG